MQTLLQRLEVSASALARSCSTGRAKSASAQLGLADIGAADLCGSIRECRYYGGPVWYNDKIVRAVNGFSDFNDNNLATTGELVFGPGRSAPGR